MAWSDLGSNECPSKADINARLREYLSWQSRTITVSGTDYTVNPGGAPWNYLFIWIRTTSPIYIPIPSGLLLSKADNSGITSDRMYLYSSTLILINKITISFNGTTGDIRIQKDNNNTTCYFTYIVFW